MRPQNDVRKSGTIGGRGMTHRNQSPNAKNQQQSLGLPGVEAFCRAALSAITPNHKMRCIVPGNLNFGPGFWRHSKPIEFSEERRILSPLLGERVTAMRLRYL